MLSVKNIPIAILMLSYGIGYLFKFLLCGLNTCNMGSRRTADEILSINVGGKKFSARRSDLTVDPQSKLYEWFRLNNAKGPPQDKAGNLYMDRDGKTFRYILDYLRMKKDKLPYVMALPSKPDQIARLLAEADALQLLELKELCVDMLLKYQREEQNCMAAYVNTSLQDYDSWQFDRKNPSANGKKRDPYGEW